MDTNLAEKRHERRLDALMDAADAEAAANDQAFHRDVAQQVEHNWQQMVSDAGYAEKLLWDWQADPIEELAEIYRELAKVKTGLVCFEDAARIVFRNIERRVDGISQSQVEADETL